MIDQALRLAEFEEQLKAQSSAAAATSKAASELVMPQPYSPSEEELHEVFLLVKELHLPGIVSDIEFRKAIAELLSPMAPIPSNAKHNCPPSLTSLGYLASDNNSNPDKF